jgi:hypothetical protein
MKVRRLEIRMQEEFIKEHSYEVEQDKIDHIFSSGLSSISDNLYLEVCDYEKWQDVLDVKGKIIGKWRIYNLEQD